MDAEGKERMQKRKDVLSLDLDCPSECLSVWAEEEEEGEEEGAIG